MNPIDEAQVRQILKDELSSIRDFNAQVGRDLYGVNGSKGIVKLFERHDTMLWVLLAMLSAALILLFIILLRG